MRRMASMLGMIGPMGMLVFAAGQAALHLGTDKTAVYRIAKTPRGSRTAELCRLA